MAGAPTEWLPEIMFSEADWETAIGEVDVPAVLSERWDSGRPIDGDGNFVSDSGLSVRRLPRARRAAAAAPPRR